MRQPRQSTGRPRCVIVCRFGRKVIGARSWVYVGVPSAVMAMALEGDHRQKSPGQEQDSQSGAQDAPSALPVCSRSAPGHDLVATMGGRVVPGPSAAAVPGPGGGCGLVLRWFPGTGVPGRDVGAKNERR
jgi:hypothetical protein